MKELTTPKPKGVGPGMGAGGADIEKFTKNRNPSFKVGGKVKSASARADGIAIRGKTRA